MAVCANPAMIVFSGLLFSISIELYQGLWTFFMSERELGIIKWFNDETGRGFILRDNGGPDAYIELMENELPAVNAWRDGQRVEFRVTHSAARVKALDICLPS